MKEADLEGRLRALAQLESHEGFQVWKEDWNTLLANMIDKIVNPATGRRETEVLKVAYAFVKDFMNIAEDRHKQMERKLKVMKKQVKEIE